MQYRRDHDQGGVRLPVPERLIQNSQGYANLVRVCCPIDVDLSNIADLGIPPTARHSQMASPAALPETRWIQSMSNVKKTISLLSK